MPLAGSPSTLGQLTRAFSQDDGHTFRNDVVVGSVGLARSFTYVDREVSCRKSLRRMLRSHPSSHSPTPNHELRDRDLSASYGIPT
jgi:hypothetical protein